jgi:prophage tail gpP-like protein
VHDVKLEVQREAHGGFQHGLVKLSMEQIASTFQLGYTDVWSSSRERVPIRRGNRCKLTVDGLTLVDGWVQEASREYDEKKRTLSASGLSTTGDLVKCSAVNKPGNWTNQHLGQIITHLCQPYAAVHPLILGDQGDPFGKFAIQRGGETSGDAVLRAARMRGFAVYTIGDDLVAARTGSERSPTNIERGRNVLKGKFTDSEAERYSDYIFKGQTRGSDTQNGVASAHMGHVVYDNGVARFMPLKVQAGGAEGPKDLGMRAVMERNQRAGRGERWFYTVKGWMRDEGGFWEPNVIHHVRDPELEVDDDLILVSSEFEFDGGERPSGFVTRLEFTHPEAFDVGEYPRRRSPRR